MSNKSCETRCAVLRTFESCYTIYARDVGDGVMPFSEFVLSVWRWQDEHPIIKVRKKKSDER